MEKLAFHFSLIILYFHLVPTRQLAAIMFTDMVGYTALMQQNEPMAVQQRDKSKKILEDALEKFEGKLLQHYGDGTLSIFSSALGAVKSAIEIQTLNRQSQIEMRIGIHTGDVMFDDTGIYGDSVNVASRIESLAAAGAVFISEKLFNEISNQGIEAKPLGYFELKNVKQPIQVYAVSNPGINIPTRDEVKGKVKQTLNSIAVLPFASLSSDPENEFFCDGITEELLNVLAKIDGLQVTSRTSSFAFKGKTEDVREIAAQLNVQKVLEGSVRKAGNKVRITAQLINAADGYHIWSETYDRSLEDIFAVQDDIGREIANKFRINLNEDTHVNEMVKPPTENLEAYKKYLQGIHYWNKQTMEGTMLALQCFHEAVAIEPGFVSPYYNIVYMTSYFPYFGMMSLKEARSICTLAADKAMKIDPNNARSQLAAGINSFFFEWDMESALRYIKKAIELNPNLAEAHFILGWYRMVMQQRDLMDEPLLTAYRLDPIGGETVPGLAEIYLWAGNMDAATHYIEEAIRDNPESMYACSIKAIVTGCKGNWKDALKLIRPWGDVMPDVPLMTAFVAHAEGMTGERERPLQVISTLLELEKQEGCPPLSPLIALIYLSLGYKENFYVHYEKAMKEKMLFCLYLYNSPLLTAVNGEERIKKLRRDYNLPE